MNVRNPNGHRAKKGPDEIDRTILRLKSQGYSWRYIANAIQQTKQAVEKRIYWMQARRWITDSGRVLSADERERLLEAERMMFPRMEVSTCSY